MTHLQFQHTVADQEQYEKEQDERMADAFADFVAGHEEAYDLDDPKHPTWFERQCERSDDMRDAARDDAMIKQMEGK